MLLIFESLGRMVRAAMGSSTDDREANRGWGCITSVALTIVLGVFALIVLGMIAQMFASPMMPVEYDD